MKKRLFVLPFALLILIMAVAFPASADTPSSIRVYLRRLQVEDTLRVTVKGQYATQDGRLSFSDGAKLVVVLRGDQLVLHTGQTAVVMGSSIKLVRCQSETPGYLLLNDGTGMYEGDLSLDIVENAIRPILTINVEDYLLGVVPFEMGDSFPLEALKAQAVTARTYALRKSGSSGAYDVEDTTNDQAYRGRTTSSPLSEQAVTETKGLCGVYRGALASCFYSASNGGQTELGQHVWPTDAPDAYGYMDMRDDPYDLENKNSVVKRYTLQKKPGEKGIGEALHQALTTAMGEQLTVLGVEADSELVRFDEIQSVEAVTPKYDGDSRLMTELRFTVKISVRDYTFRQTPSPQPAASSTPHADETPAPTATPAFSPYRKVKETVTVTLPIFTEAERAMGLSINVSQNELITVSDIGSAFLIESRRFGHGVGMSQRGAEQMARQYGMTYEQILAFYYPGMGLVSYDTGSAPLPTLNAELMATPAPTPSPTPRPTLMPVSTNQMPEGAYLAIVSNIDEDSTLNLREQPNTSAEVIRRLYKNQPLIVLSVSKDGWAHVKTDVMEGYVRSEYLQAEKDS
ncbi:MAG: SpoIID/LytB domain-containing protein [Clostridiales bacterium]|nr:SpoIID/LytB domain-containing protein [Clostridiales bacterium]